MRIATGLFSIAGILLLIVNSCEPFRCRKEYQFVADNALLFNVLDKNSQENLMRADVTPYSYDTVKIYNEDGEIVYPIGPRWDSYHGQVVLDILDRERDFNVINQRIDRSFYFYFDQHDTDTISIGFELNRDECNDPVISYFKVSYNGKIYFDAQTDHVPRLDFKK